MNNEFGEDYFEIVSCNYDIDTNEGIFYEKVGKHYEARKIMEMAGFEEVEVVERDE